MLIFSPGMNAASFIADAHTYIDTEPVATGKLTGYHIQAYVGLRHTGTQTQTRTHTEAYAHRSSVIALLRSFSTSKAEIPRGHPSHPVTVAHRHDRAPPGCSHLNL